MHLCPEKLPIYALKIYYYMLKRTLEDILISHLKINIMYLFLYKLTIFINIHMLVY